MKIESYRSSFVICVCDSQLASGHSIAEAIANVGYTVEHKLNEDKFWQDAESNPPHVVVVRFDDSAFCIGNEQRAFIENLIHKLPESQIILLSPQQSFATAIAFYDAGVFDVVRSPAESEFEVIKAVDRACELNYFLYMNEQLKEKLGMSNTAHSPDFSLFEMWLRKLSSMKTPQECIDSTANELYRMFSGIVLYMRYSESHSTLVADSACGLDSSIVKDIGIDLSATEPGFEAEMLQAPQKLIGLKNFVKSGLSCLDYFAVTLVVDDQCLGLFLLASTKPNYYKDSRFNSSVVRSYLLCLGRQISNLSETEKRLKLSNMDEESAISNSSTTAVKIREEITRSRRILRPTSLLLIGIDGLAALRLEHTKNTLKNFLHAMAEVFVQNSRINDFVGRWSEDLFVVVLPHTDRKGAAIKAERLRRIVERADFSRVFGVAKNVTVRIGVSEYPYMCHDAEGLINVAEGALNEVARVGGNRVCLASPPQQFVPDFQAGEV